MNLYLYEGPVLEFGKRILDHWYARTYAVSKSKAICNFMYQYKNNNNKSQATKIDLPGKINVIE